MQSLISLQTNNGEQFIISERNFIDNNNDEKTYGDPKIVEKIISNKKFIFLSGDACFVFMGRNQSGEIISSIMPIEEIKKTKELFINTSEITSFGYIRDEDFVKEFLKQHEQRKIEKNGIILAKGNSNIIGGNFKK